MMGFVHHQGDEALMTKGFLSFFGWGKSEETFLTARLNAKLQPMDRGEIYEDPLAETLQKNGLGDVTGGGTQLADFGIEFCDLEIRVNATDDTTLQTIASRLEELGAPKGSRLMIDGQDRELPFGRTEGLAVYLNGTDLDENVYQDCDVNHVIEEFNRLLSGAGAYHSHWRGERETALYLYGDCAATMRERIGEFIANYPLCESARLEQVA